MGALEERARSDLGMIAGNETFYQVVPPHPVAQGTEHHTRTAARSGPDVEIFHRYWLVMPAAGWVGDSAKAYPNNTLTFMVAR